jgi:signal transduction histidine kinase
MTGLVSIGMMAPEGQVDGSNVLKRFYRLEQSRTSPGSGLGFALVKAIAELHDAALSLSDNRPGLLIELHFQLAGR